MGVLDFSHPPPGAAFAERSEAARAALKTEGLPTRRAERWKYTAIDRLAETGFQSVGRDAALAADVTPPEPLVEAAHRLVFVDGWFRADLSRVGDLPRGAVIDGLSALSAAASVLPPSPCGAIGRLNAAWAQDGAAILLPPDCSLDAPVELVWLQSDAAAPQMAHPLLSVSVGRGAKLTLIERMDAPAGGLVTQQAALRLYGDASLTHAILQRTGQEATLLREHAVLVEDGARYDGFAFTDGRGLSRIEAEVKLGGPGAHAALNGAYLARDGGHADATLRFDHAAPHGTSRQTWMGVIGEGARGVFQGKIHVAQDAQKTDGFQLSRALLLSDKAEIDAKPELEIYADDVKCSHGASIGQLDAMALFYLRSRGIPEAVARALLIRSFLAEAVDLAPAAVHDAIWQAVEDWLGAVA